MSEPDHIDELAYLSVLVGGEAMHRYAEEQGISRKRYVEMTTSPEFLLSLQRYNFAFIALPRNRDVVEAGISAGEARDAFVNGVVPDFMAKKRPDGLFLSASVEGPSYVDGVVSFLEKRLAAGRESAGHVEGDDVVGELGPVGGGAEPAERGGAGGVAGEVGVDSDGDSGVQAAREAEVVSRCAGEDEVVPREQPVPPSRNGADGCGDGGVASDRGVERAAKRVVVERDGSGAGVGAAELPEA